MSEKRRRIFLRATAIACGVLGFILFRWTPTTDTGVFIYVALFAALVFIAIILSSPKRGYWPKKPEDH